MASPLFAPIALGWFLWVIFFFVTLVIFMMRGSNLRTKFLGFFTATGTLVFGMIPQPYVYLAGNETISVIYSQLPPGQPFWDVLFLLGFTLLAISMTDLLFMLLSIMSGRGGGMK